MSSLIVAAPTETVPLRRNRNFRLLLVGHGTSLIGNAAVPVGISFAVLRQPGASAGTVAWVLAAETVPTLVLVLFGGTWADRFDRRRLMIISDLVRLGAAALAGVSLLAGYGGLGLLAALMAVYGVGAAIYQPAVAGLIPQTVGGGSHTGDGEQLQRADGVLMAVAGTSWVLGPALAGLLIATAEPGAVFVLDAITFAVSAACLARMRLPRRRRGRRFVTAGDPSDGPSVEAVGTSLLRDMVDGWREFSSRSWVWMTIASVGAMFAFVVAPLNSIGPAVASERLHGATGWAIIVAALSLGRICGGLLGTVWLPRRPLLVGAALVLLEGPAMLVLALDAPLGVVAVAQALGGLGVGFFLTVWGFCLQRWIPPERLSRVNSYDWFGTLLATPLGYGLVAVGVGVLGTRGVLLISTVMVVVAVVPLLLSRSVQSLGRGPELVGNR